MNSLDAVERILAASGSPLNVKVITDRILGQQLWTTRGKTPGATIEARIATDIKRYGALSRFERVAPGLFTLRSPSPGVTTTALPATLLASTSVSFTDAADLVLRGTGRHEALPYREITERALAQGLLMTKGRTPAATLYSQVYAEIERSRARGTEPRFFRDPKGLIGLTEWLPRGLAGDIVKHNRAVKDDLRSRVIRLTSDEFEALVGVLLTRLGIENVDVVGRTGDGGIDVRGVLVVGDVVRIPMAIQAKRWKIGNNVGSGDVRNVRGGLDVSDRALIVTTSDFTPAARRDASMAGRVPVGLMKGAELVEQLVGFGIGVERTDHKILESAPISLAP